MGDDYITLYHRGDLSGGVSSRRVLNVGESPELTQYHPDGQLYEFRVPKRTFNEWRANGVATPQMDLRDGIYTRGWQIWPRASGEMNNFMVRP